MIHPSFTQVSYRRTEQGARRRMLATRPLSRLVRGLLEQVRYKTPHDPRTVPARLPVPSRDALARARALHWLKDLKPVRSRLSGQEAIRAIADWHGISVEMMLGTSKTDVVFAARADAIEKIYLDCEHADGSPYTITEIARLVHRDHSSVLNVLNRRGIRTRGQGDLTRKRQANQRERFCQTT